MKRAFLSCVSFVVTVAVQAAQPCVQLPASLFHEVTSVFPEGVPEGAWISGSGKTLGILVPELPKGHKLFLLRGEKIVSELWLEAPTNPPFPRPPSFALVEDGDVAVLKVVNFFVVYVGASLAGVVDGDNAQGVSVGGAKGSLCWTPSLPSVPWVFGKKELLERAKEAELPALLVCGELDGTGQQVLLRLDPRRLTEEDPEPLYQGLSVAARADGKLWLVGRWTGDIMLVTTAGKILRHAKIPWTLKRPEDDPETRAKMEQEMLDESRTWFEEQRNKGKSDATKRPPIKVEMRVKFKTPLFRREFARDRDLVLLMNTSDPPQGSLMLIRDGEETGTCFQLPRRLTATGQDLPRNLAVTRDAIWLLRPLGYLPWGEIEAFLETDAAQARATNR